jgi:excisionase family DNA binding protein
MLGRSWPPERPIFRWIRAKTRMSSPDGRCIDEMAVALCRMTSPLSSATTNGFGTSMVCWRLAVNETLDTNAELLVTPEEAARRLALGRTTVYGLIARGELESVVIGRCRRIPVSSLRDFVVRLVGGDSSEQAGPPPS